jgi:predicted nucleotidyltransferase
MTEHRRGIDAGLHEQVLRVVRSTTTSVMLFGSFARGDASPESDVDVLELGRRTLQMYTVGRFNVYQYSTTHLQRLSEAGSLFALHLKLEGRIIRDLSSDLHRCLETYRTPSSYDSHRLIARGTANLLDIDRQAYGKSWRLYNDLALFVLRTALYIKLAEAGEPTFSLKRIAIRLQEPDVGSALTLKHASIPNFELFSSCVRLISRTLATQIHNPFGSIEALVTNEGLENPSLFAFGLRLLGVTKPSIAYDLLSFV